MNILFFRKCKAFIVDISSWKYELDLGWWLKWVIEKNREEPVLVRLVQNKKINQSKIRVGVKVTWNFWGWKKPRSYKNVKTSNCGTYVLMGNTWCLCSFGMIWDYRVW